MTLPSEFCWTKYGVEAGETPETIIARKKREMADNDDLFLWRTGSSIRPSLLELLEHNPAPDVVFTPMLSAPAARDKHHR